MRAELTRPDDPGRIVGAAEWDGVRARVTEAEDDQVRAAFERIFRVSPVAIDDPSRRRAGTSGPVLAEPGDLDWFMAAAEVRGAAEGFGVRFAPERPGGWDPAAAYRPLREWVSEREASRGPGP